MILRDEGRERVRARRAPFETRLREAAPGAAPM